MQIMCAAVLRILELLRVYSYNVARIWRLAIRTLVFATRRDLLPTQSQVLKRISTWRLPWGIWDTGRGMSRYKSDSGILLM